MIIQIISVMAFIAIIFLATKAIFLAKASIRLERDMHAYTIKRLSEIIKEAKKEEKLN